MPGSVYRAVAIIGMIGVVALSFWLWLVGGLAGSGVFENQEPSDMTAGSRLALVAAVTGLGALGSLVGLALRLRVPAAVGAIVVIGGAVTVFADSTWGHLKIGHDDNDLRVALLGAVCFGAAALVAALTRPSATVPSRG